MSQLKNRFKTERSSFSPAENVALRIVQVVERLRNNLDRGVETGCMVEIHRLLGFLNGRISSADSARVVVICADVPVQLEHWRHDMVAATIREMLDELKNWSSDEEQNEVAYKQIQPGDHWKDSSGGEYQAVQGRFDGRDVVLSYPLTGISAFELLPALSSSMMVFKIIRH